MKFNDVCDKVKKQHNDIVKMITFIESVLGKKLIDNTIDSFNFKFLYPYVFIGDYEYEYNEFDNIKHDLLTNDFTSHWKRVVKKINEEKSKQTNNEIIEDKIIEDKIYEL